ncbi:MAG: hypothetical protein K9K66_19395 [Desulfarculaceae bacterium]|nr:hypothetical protein [Desulfarculaceae bacterium]MCF8074376.1 hypothetical protein [Desulfarculaceae bacterium]MCF8103821.1 hypothetical protein [Desulfarculaceae bacterium]MCF8118160.1 hypothetical protein [Desulfarculaceae bacterium]
MKISRARLCLACLSALVLLLALTACGASYDQETYAKIQINMSLKEVIGILGEPTESKGVTLGGMSGTSASWKDDNGTISIQFVNGKVKMKSFTKPD